MPIMDGDYVGRRRRWQTVAVLLLVCSLAPSLTGFNLKGLSVKVAQDKQASEAAEMQVWSGSIFFNGEEPNFQSGPLSAAATENDGLLHTDLYQPDGTDLFEQTSQQQNDKANEAAWRRMNFSLQCGHNKMTLKAMGPGTGDLQLDMGNARSIPLIRVPKTCGYSMHQNELGFVLVVLYDGCNVIQENGRYMLPMRWSESPVKFVCPMSPSPDTTTSEPAQQSQKFPFHRKLWNRLRSKRDVNHHHSIFDPGSLYYHNLYNYYMYVMNTILTTNTQEKLPGYPFYPNYIYYPYYPYYPPQNLPEMTTVSQATTGHGTTLNTPQKNPYYPMYYPYPHYQPEGLLQETPYYFGSPYPSNNQNLQGKPQYPQTPNLPTQATELPPTTGSKPLDPSLTTKPTSELTTKPPTIPTAEPTTICAKRKYKICAGKTTTTGSGSDPGQQKPYVPLNQLPFAPYVSYKAAGKVPGDQTDVPEAGGKTGIQAPERSEGDADLDADLDGDADADLDGDAVLDVDADADIPSFPDSTDEDGVEYD